MGDEPGEGNSELIDGLVRRANEGDQSALATLFDKYRPRLRRMVQLRLDRRLRGRVGASDVLQEAYIDLARRLPDYAQHPTLPFFLWLRLITGQRLLHVHRQHLQTAKRDATLEVSLFHGAIPQATTTSLAENLIGRVTSASQRALRAEIQLKLQEVLNAMDPIDREILVLRHFEELSNAEVARALCLSKSAASNRYIRALKRLKTTMEAISKFFNA